ncbi:MAG: hypothetical protein LBI34_02060 [Puniceicoccales bacterium]|jgi:ubiquitin C-terminal hydrolase|nr:hypothetical protein [Puniceicoccales bacterium]
MLSDTILPKSQILAAPAKSPQEELDRILVRINTKRFTPAWWGDVIVLILCIIFIPAGAALVAIRIAIDRRNKVPITIGGIVWWLSRSLTHEKCEIPAQHTLEESPAQHMLEELPAQHAREEPSSNLEPATEAEVQSDTGIELPKKKSMEEFNLSWARGVALRMLEGNLDPTGPPIGIPNYGNSCYINTAIQCMYHHNLFRMLVPVLCEIFPPDLPGGDMREVLKEFFACLAAGIQVSRELFDKLKNALARRNRIYADSRQNDSFECLACMVTGLEIDGMARDYVDGTIEAAFQERRISKEDLALLILSGIYKNKQHTCTYEYESNDKTPNVGSTLCFFGGRHHATLTFPSCGHVEDIYQPGDYNNLAVSCSLAESIVEYESLQLMRGDNGLYCRECRDYRDVNRAVTLEPSCQYLTFQIKRFIETGRGQLAKSDAQFEFPQKIIVGDKTYRLRCYGCHSGTLNGGHYFAYVFRGGDCYEISDSSVRKFTPGDPVRSNNVMYIVYELVP